MVKQLKEELFRRMRPRKLPQICDYCMVSRHIWRRCINRFKDFKQGIFISKPNLVADRKFDRFRGNKVHKRDVKSFATHLSLKANTPCSCTLTVHGYSQHLTTNNEVLTENQSRLKRNTIGIRDVNREKGFWPMQDVN